MKFSRVWPAAALAGILMISGRTMPVTTITPLPVAETTNILMPTLAPMPTHLPSPAVSLMPSPSPTPEPDMHDMYYTEGGEYYYIDPEGNYWLYSCEDLYVYVQKLYNVELHISYYVANIYIKNPEQIAVGLSDDKNPGANRVIQEKLAAKHKAVLSFNGDFFTDRNTGIIIRNGKVWRNRPNEAILAFCSDGEMKVFDGTEKTPEEMLAEGVTNTFAFGPILIRDGQIYSDAIAKHPLRGLNPRTGIGMVEKGHYVAIVVEGRQAGYSRGIRLDEFAKLFAGYDCQVAYNLDGGQSSVVTFMGLPLNNHNKDSGVNQELGTFRRIPEILFFGTSQDVPTRDSKTNAVTEPPGIVDWLNHTGVTNIPTVGQTPE